MHWLPIVERTDFGHCAPYYDDLELAARIQIDFVCVNKIVSVVLLHSIDHLVCVNSWVWKNIISNEKKR